MYPLTCRGMVEIFWLGSISMFVFWGVAVTTLTLRPSFPLGPSKSDFVFPHIVTIVWKWNGFSIASSYLLRTFHNQIYNFPAFLRVFFLAFRALARILFLADLALRSLNLSRSVRPALLAFTAIRLLHVDCSHFSLTWKKNPQCYVLSFENFKPCWPQVPYEQSLLGHWMGTWQRLVSAASSWLGTPVSRLQRLVHQQGHGSGQLHWRWLKTASWNIFKICLHTSYLQFCQRWGRHSARQYGQSQRIFWKASLLKKIRI